MKMHKIIISVLTLFIISNCKKHANDYAVPDNGRITITSQNEPKNDADALAILNIKMNPNPKVLFREYQVGLDDNMKLVLEFSSDQLQPFKDSIKWDDQLTASKGVTLPIHVNEIWNSHTSSRAGLYGTYRLPNSAFVRVYIAEDLTSDTKRVFLFWHET